MSLKKFDRAVKEVFKRAQMLDGSLMKADQLYKALHTLKNFLFVHVIHKHLNIPLQKLPRSPQISPKK